MQTDLRIYGAQVSCRTTLTILKAAAQSGPDALEWKPERWLTPLPESIMESKVPGVYAHLYVQTIYQDGSLYALFF
jgi:hypothetical protein